MAPFTQQLSSSRARSATLAPAITLAVALLISNRTARLLPRPPPGSSLAASLAALPGLVGLVVICQAIDIGKVLLGGAWCCTG